MLPGNFPDYRTDEILKRFGYLVIPLVFVFAMSSCRSKPGAEWEAKSYKYAFSPSEFKRCLLERLTKADVSAEFQAMELENFDSLKSFYHHNDFIPVMIKSFEDSASVEAVLKVIAGAKDHGLDPEFYRYQMIRQELSELYTSRKTNTLSAYNHMVNVELLLSDAVMKYSHNMRYGVVNPLKIFHDYFLPYADSGKGRFLTPLYQENILSYLKSVQPSGESYLKMQKALKHFEQLENSPWPSVPEFAVKLKKGSKDPQLKLVAQRLASLGFIDTLQVNINTIDTFDSTIIIPIIKFQRAQGLTPDGTPGKETVRKLNIPPGEYVEKIKLNMERLRWANCTKEDRYIYVNIPDFYLHAIEKEKELFSIKVCTGKNSPDFDKQLKQKKNAVNWETPMLYGEISHIVLNPTWTVPVNIVKKEIYGLSVRDSNYLRNNNFKIFKNGKEVSMRGIQLSKYSPNHLPFTFVQDPGAGNALGKIKFMFENGFGIYLHDTPTRSAFLRSNRAVSHGCVRVEKPFVLAEYILKDNSRWDIDFIKLETGTAISDQAKTDLFHQTRNELRRGGAEGKTTRIKLEKKIPLYIDYFTAWVDAEGYVNLRDDVYEKDKLLSEHFPPGVPNASVLVKAN